jgi:hypothetical protein
LFAISSYQLNQQTQNTQRYIDVTADMKRAAVELV